MKFKILFLSLALAMATKASAFTVEVTGTNSMLPTLHKGQRVECQMFIPYSYLKAGDIVVFKSVFFRGGLIIHRLVRFQQAGFLHAAGWITKGDNNDKTDPGLLIESNYVGRVQI